MKKLRNSVWLTLLASVALAQTGDMVPPEVRRVGDRLACLCRSCKNTVATCQMLGCGYMTPARARIVEMHKQGSADDAIVADFVSRQGKAALAVPPAEGFNITAWVVPPLVLLLGFGVVGWFIRTRRQAAMSKPQSARDADYARYSDAAERELSRFEE
jgi:cytochrome c-type biogenesis protein CcmH